MVTPEVSINSRYLTWFHALERELWRLFGVFGDLCERCARRTLREAGEGDRSRRDEWCCCMIDNQVHDHWESLNRLQCRRDVHWYAKLQPLPIGRMPGNGPCPALGPSGCRLAAWRPVTCTTQLCPKMLRVLKRLGLFDGPTSAALQIEDLLPLPDILPALIGQSGRQPRRVAEPDVRCYRDAVRGFRRRMVALPAARLRAAVDAELPPEG